MDVDACVFSVFFLNNTSHRFRGTHRFETRGVVLVCDGFLPARADSYTYP